MNRNRIITIINELKDFNYFESSGKAFKGSLQKTLYLDLNKNLVDHEINIILFVNLNSININLLKNDSHQMSKQLYKDYFLFSELETISRLFNLNYMERERDGVNTINIGSLEIIHWNFNHKRHPAHVCIYKSAKITYIIIFYYEDEDMGRIPLQLYIHGVWEVELSSDFTQKLFLK
ncbi:MAG: hypothetical protein IPP42_18005 [Saprospiraceae bacterium]|nr:hypothetical protein [Saprospiraceae bacterium]